MLFKTPTLGEDELRVIGRINEMRKSLHYAVTQSKRWTGLLRRSTLARAVRGSNSIEGYNVTVEDAIALAEGEEPMDATAETKAAVSGYQSAMTYVLQLSDDPHFAYSINLIRSLHFMMLQHDLGKHPGRWRPGPIYVHDDDLGERVYEGPDADKVPPLMDELIAWLQAPDQTPAMVRAGMSHLNLVMIHPFSDGNGRMARCLQSLMLAREQILAPAFCSIEEHLGRVQKQYYAVLADVGAGSWHPERDARPWIRFTLRAHYTQAARLLRRQREFHRVADDLEQEVVRRGLPERSVFAVLDAAFGWRVRNSTYRSMAEVSDQVAGKDLRSLAEAKLLIAKGERRGRWYAAGPMVLAIRERHRETRNLEDPFETEGQMQLL